MTTAAPAGAAPGRPETPARVAHGDACGPRWAAAVPDSGYAPSYFNFHEACHTHDWCYEVKPHGRHNLGRARCDAAFLADMLSWCNGRYPRWYHVVQRENCHSLARTYAAAVAAGGAPSFYL